MKVLHQFPFPNFRALWCCVFFLCVSITQAQVDTSGIDSADTPGIFDYRDAHVEFSSLQLPGQWFAVDTSLDQFYQFHPARKDQVFEPVWLGNLGAPVTTRYFAFTRALGFDYGRHERDPYITDLDEVKFWRSNVPFTRVGYVIGQYSEQFFYVQHTRNFGPQWNMSLDFKKIASEGYYQHMLNDYGNTALTVWYHTKNERYQIYLAGIRDKSYHEENGGINNDTLFDYPSPELAEPFRDVAFSEWDNWQGSITQKYQFGKYETYQVNDTTQGTYFKPMMVLSHSFRGTTHNYLFEDAADDIAIYGNLFYTADTLRDRTQVSGFSQVLALESPFSYVRNNNITEYVPAHWNISLTQQWHEVADHGGSRVFQNLVAKGVFISPQFWKDRLKVMVSGGYDLQSGAYQLRGRLMGYQNTLKPALNVYIGKLDPTVMDQRYFGFDRSWDFPGDQTQVQSAEIMFVPKHFEVHLMYSRFQDLYFTGNTYAYDPGEESQIVPFTIDEIALSQFWLRKQFTPGPFVLDNALGWQYSPDDYWNMPVALFNANWYYQGHLFKRALYTHLGVHAWYSSRYRVLPYDMITGRFMQQYSGYLQSWPLEEMRYTPVLDVYASVDIRTFRFFIKVDNVAQGLFDKGFYQSPNYPMQPRGVKLGLDWSLYY